jgi:membrane-associated phospholipid phosphatase
MKDINVKPSCCLLLLLTTTLGAVPAMGQSIAETRRCGTSSTAPLIDGTLRGVTRIPDKTSLAILSLGAAAAFGSHAADSQVTASLARGERDRLFKPGATIGGMPFSVGASAALMTLGAAMQRPCLGTLGSELLQAQLIGAGWTIALKQAVQRDRPVGNGLSFPSGHTTTAFASATVLQRRFGWKAGIPAYGVATYVAASRVEMKRHYLSDVAFGAALGIVAGRTVSIGGGHRLMVTPLATDYGGAVGFSLLKK